MLTVNWSAERGWGTPEIRPYGPLQLMPTASVLHYATECFEGMKAYRGHDGKLRLFRPEKNCARMLKSATRIALPGFDPKELQKLIERFVAIEGPRWIPDGENGERGQFLYLRPTMIGTAAAIGVQTPQEAMFFLIAVMFPPLDEPEKRPREISSGSEVAQGVKMNGERENKEAGMRLLASQHDTVRAWPGGFGNAKVGANYGPSLVATGKAKDLGYGQILWLFGKEGYVTEAGAANFFVLWKTREGQLQLVTAPLGDGVILEGVTRQSVLDIAREKLSGEVEVVERKYTMLEVQEAAEEGRLLEAFGCGTAYFIAPVQDIHFRGKDIELPLAVGEGAKYAMNIKKWIKDIMFGNEQHEWGVVVEEEAAVSGTSTPSALERANEWLKSA